MSFAGLGGGEVKLLGWLKFKLELNIEPIIEFRANQFGLVESLGWRPKKGQVARCDLSMSTVSWVDKSSLLLGRKAIR